jgi:hypothetical protein
MFAGKAGAYLKGLYVEGGLLTMPSNDRLGWEWLAETNTLAYYVTELITAVKSFTVQGLLS